jgi:hypothetical protein
MIVVSRYQENVEWTREFPNVLIYNKGEPLDTTYRAIQTENVGREGHTFYKYIYDNYENLEDYTIFLQGNPFDHTPTIREKLLNYGEAENLNIDFEFVSSNILTTNLRGCQYHGGLPLIQVYQYLFGEWREDFEFQFGQGGQFIVSKRAIHRRPREFYFKVMNLLSHDVCPIEGYVIERFHGLIFAA